MTNEERSKVGVDQMRYHKLLEVAAYNHSLKMATTGFFSHQNTVDATRYSKSDRGKLAGISNPSFAENIAYNFPGNGSTYLQVAEKLIVQWMNSSGHKENILSTNGRQMGCGAYYFEGKIYGTQVFQWFSDVIEDANGGVDQLPKAIIQSNSNNNQTVVSANNTTSTATNNNPISSTNISNTTQFELSELKNKVAQLNGVVSEKEATIVKLNGEIASLKTENSRLNTLNTTLNNSNNTLKQQQLDKDGQINTLTDQLNKSSRGGSSAKNNQYYTDDSRGVTFKIGLNTFYPSINPSGLGKFNMSYFSFGIETMMGGNFGDSFRKNSIGITLRASQTNRFLTRALDSNALRPMQYYDAELTTIMREWLSFGVGASLISAYDANNFQVVPSASLGLCLGPKNWKIQLTQQVSLNADKKFFGRASIGIALRL
jgi:hypothetical protein